MAQRSLRLCRILALGPSRGVVSKPASWGRVGWGGRAPVELSTYRWQRAVPGPWTPPPSCGTIRATPGKHALPVHSPADQSPTHAPRRHLLRAWSEPMPRLWPKTPSVFVSAAPVEQTHARPFAWVSLTSVPFATTSPPAASPPPCLLARPPPTPAANTPTMVPAGTQCSPHCVARPRDQLLASHAWQRQRQRQHAPSPCPAPRTWLRTAQTPQR